MTEYERIREQITFILFGKLTTEEANRKAGQILSLDGIEIRADDCSLPKNPHSPMVDGKFGTFGEGQESMLRADSKGRHFVKVISKRNKEEK